MFNRFSVYTHRNTLDMAIKVMDRVEHEGHYALIVTYVDKTRPTRYLTDKFDQITIKKEQEHLWQQLGD